MVLKVERGMIASFRDSWLKDFFVDDIHSKKIPADIADRVFRKLQMLDDASCDADLRTPSSNHFEKLQGRLAGRHSIRINSRWRLVFEWNGARGEAFRVYLDNHDYR
jgi:proteic killer suppression protein